MKLPFDIPKDKIQHVSVGLMIVLPFVIVSHYLHQPWIKHVGLAAAMGVGYLKEKYDSKHLENHTPDFNDFTATAFGAFFAHLF